MENKDKILKIKELIRILGITDRKFAELIGIFPSEISKYLNDKQPITEKLLKRILDKFPNLNPSWLLLGVGEMFNNPNNSTNTSINRAGNVYGNTNSNINTEGTSSIGGMLMETTKQQSTPYFNVESAACGALSGFGEALTANNSDCCVVLPTLSTKNGDVFLQTRGRSMIDTKCPKRSIPEGAMVLVRKWNHSFIEWGEIYCVITTDGYVIKKLMPGTTDNHIKCVSADSENFPPYEISADEIKDIGRVIAVVSTKML